jgi:hypothetical protein
MFFVSRKPPANRDYGFVPVDPGFPTLAVLEALQGLLGHEDDNHVLGLGPDLPAVRTRGKIV